MQESRPSLLYLVHRIPYPPNKGDKVRSFNILRQLALRYRVFLGTFVDQAEDLEHIGKLSEWCEACHVVRLNPRRARVASLRGLLSGEALSLPYYRDAGMARWVKGIVADKGIRQAVAFSGPMAQYLDIAGLEQRVIDYCDVDSAKWAQYAAQRRWPMSWLYRREGARLLAFERAAAARVDASLFVTEAEAALFRGLAPEVASRVGVMQNGVDADYFSPAHELDNPFPAGGPVIVFTGAMDYWPNIDAVSWFASEIMPVLRARHPGLRFWIVGMNPAVAVEALAAKDVIVTGSVPDVRPYLAHADLVVAPLRVARGIQNKVLEAMAMACPVVVSKASTNGLDADPGVEFAQADAPSEYCVQIDALLSDPERRRQMGIAARNRVVAQYAWAAHLALIPGLLGEPRAKEQAVLP